MKILRIKYGYHISRRLAARARQSMERSLKAGRIRPLSSYSVPDLNFSLAMIAGRTLMPDAVRALRSFVRYVGLPAKLWLASDGTLSDSDIENLSRVVPLPRDRLARLSVERGDFELRGAALSHPLIRKLGAVINLPLGSEQCLYMDTDIEFFAAAASLPTELRGLGGPAFLSDPTPSLDARLLRFPHEWDCPVNSGLLWLPSPLDWRPAIDRLAELPRDAEVTHFTEQTVVHLAMRHNRGIALDSRRFVVSVADQFEWRDRFAHQPGVACRHYVTPVRHKMWMLRLA